MNDRLQKFLAAENISQSQLADTLGVARASISHIISGRNKPGFDFLESMAVNFPALSIEWLITGKGKMYRGGDPLSAEENASGLFSLSCPADKIDRIVVFFSDGTYKEFR
ncbi:MAG: helix-turn-helix transcriptional regulator [Bacteroidales bacterium]|nr:helix-turn-helix transcriptional regulator [Bacteroidales bacterium]